MPRFKVVDRVIQTIIDSLCVRVTDVFEADCRTLERGALDSLDYDSEGLFAIHYERLGKGSRTRLKVRTPG